MAKKQRSYFGPASGEELVHLPSTNSLARYAGQEPPSPRLEALFEEADVQNITIDAQKLKTMVGLSSIADIHDHAAGLFGDTLNTILESKDVVLDKEAQPMVQEFTTRQAGLFGRQELGILEVSGKVIGFEINRALYVLPPEPKPEPKKGFFARLFGG